MRAIVVILGLCLAAAGCSRGAAPDLLSLPSTGRPDEFSILPTEPLQTPPDLAALPAPTPGGVNRADPRPKAEAIAALGGNPAAQGRPSADGALLSHTTRFGVAPDIRRSLRAADLDYRRANDGRVLERAFNVNIYFRAYEAQSLDSYEELERFRRAGVSTPAVPPPPPEN